MTATHANAGQPLGGDLGVGGRRRGQQEDRIGAVARRDTAESTDHRCHVRSEEAAVVVHLVDDDVTEPAQEGRPARVPGEHGVMQHVGVGEHDVGVVAHPLALLARGVAVVGRDAQAIDVECIDPPTLVGSQRLGGTEVEHRRATLDAPRRGWSAPRGPRA